MKKYLALLACLMLFASVNAFAGGGNQNQSAEWVKTLSRNASTDVDAAFYNPAGTSFMDGGLYLYFDYQCIIQPITIKGSGSGSAFDKEYDGQKSAYYFGNLYLSYVKDNLGPGDLGISLFFLPVGGGGGGTFKDGIPAIGFAYANPAFGAAARAVTDMSVEATEAMYSGQANISYAFAEKKASIALGYRFIYYDASYLINITSTGGVGPVGSAKDKVDASLTGIGHGIIAGLSLAPLKSKETGDFIIGLKTEWFSELEATADSDNKIATTIVGPAVIPVLASQVVDKAKTYKTLPPTLGIGMSYAIAGVKMALSITNYLNGISLKKGAEDGDGVDMDVAFGIDYTLPMIPLNIGIGYLYAMNNTPQVDRNQLNEALSAHTVGGGLSYTFMEKYKLTIAYCFGYYLPVDVNEGSAFKAAGIEAEYKKTSHDISLGFQAKLL